MPKKATSNERLRRYIRSARVAKDITQAKLAEKLGYSPSGYAKIEKKISTADFKTVCAMCKILSIDITDLYRIERGLIE